MNILLSKKVLLVAILSLFIALPIFAKAEVFANYEQAIEFVKSTYVAETIHSDSTAIYRAEYYDVDGQSGYLMINFQSNKTKSYIYANVPSDIWQGFKDAPSKGRYYNKEIKGRYRLPIEENDD